MEQYPLDQYQHKILINCNWNTGDMGRAGTIFGNYTVAYVRQGCPSLVLNAFRDGRLSGDSKPEILSSEFDALTTQSLF